MVQGSDTLDMARRVNDLIEVCSSFHLISLKTETFGVDTKLFQNRTNMISLKVIIEPYSPDLPRFPSCYTRKSQLKQPSCTILKNRRMF